MKNQNLKLDFIESGRMSEIEMSETYGGYILCDVYTNCHAAGKNSCSIFYKCSNDTNYVYCTTREWIILSEDELDVLCVSSITA